MSYCLASLSVPALAGDRGRHRGRRRRDHGQQDPRGHAQPLQEGHQAEALHGNVN